MVAKEKLDLGEEKPKPSPKRLIFTVLGIALAVLGAAFATLYYLGIVPPNAQGAGHGKKEAQAEQRPVIYLALNPPFAANFKNSSEARLVQIEMAVASTDQRVIDAVVRHSPMLRNNILMILGGDDPAVLKTREGKEALRTKIKDEIRRVVTQQTEVKAGVDEVYFTGFVMQ
jgi:flagellar FliL protein